jgi:hypothetical protein
VFTALNQAQDDSHATPGDMANLLDLTLKGIRTVARLKRLRRALAGPPSPAGSAVLEQVLDELFEEWGVDPWLPGTREASAHLRSRR